MRKRQCKRASNPSNLRDLNVGGSRLVRYVHLREDGSDSVPARSFTSAEAATMLAHAAYSYRPRFGHQELTLHAGVTEHGLVSYQGMDGLADCQLLLI